MVDGWIHDGFDCLHLHFFHVFFGADKTIDYSMSTVIKEANSKYERVSKRKNYRKIIRRSVWIGF